MANKKERMYRICPSCGCRLRSERYDAHMESQHSPEAERQKELQLIKKQEKLEKKKKEGEVIVRCSICSIEVKRKNLKKHERKAHHIFTAMNAVARKKGSISKRKKRIKKLFGPDREYSEDVFDRGRVFSGGAYGLGRSRKH